MTTSPDVRFLIRHPAHMLALGWGAGLIPRAPGTCGTLIALPLFAGLMLLPAWSHLGLIGLMFIIGIPVCERAGAALGEADHGSIVWDEIVAMLLVLEFTSRTWPWWVTAFLLFRLFDIWKPFPIRQCDVRVKSGLGVMLDDLLAALYTIATLKVLQWITTHF